MPSLQAMAREAKSKLKTATPKTRVSRKPAASIFKSTERVAESDLESETESESGSESGEEPMETTPLAAKANGQRANPAGSSSDSDSEDADADADESKSSDEDSSEDGTDTDCGSGSDSQVGKASAPDRISITAAGSLRKSPQPVQASPMSSKPVPVYTPPNGFQRVTTTTKDDGKMKVAQVFSHSNLAGKQLWYITVPASVPINAVEQVSLQDVQLGKAALLLNGHEYGFVQDQAEDNGYTKIMIPDDKSTTYCIGRKAIDRTLHLQRMIKLPNRLNHVVSQNARAQRFNRSTVPAKKPVRQQPEGLKMRFRPIGFGNGKTGTIGSSSSSSDVASSTDSDTDEDMEDAPAVQQPLRCCS